MRKRESKGRRGQVRGSVRLEKYTRQREQNVPRPRVGSRHGKLGDFKRVCVAGRHREPGDYCGWGLEEQTGPERSRLGDSSQEQRDIFVKSFKAMMI